MNSAYIKQLKLFQEVEKGHQSRKTGGLEERVTEWFASLPEVSRQRPYSMCEIELALGTQGKYLSPILLGLGWERKRKWSSQRHYHRYWNPPEG